MTSNSSLTLQKNTHGFALFYVLFTHQCYQWCNFKFIKAQEYDRSATVLTVTSYTQHISTRIWLLSVLSVSVALGVGPFSHDVDSRFSAASQDRPQGCGLHLEIDLHSTWGTYYWTQCQLSLDFFYPKQFRSLPRNPVHFLPCFQEIFPLLQEDWRTN